MLALKQVVRLIVFVSGIYVSFTNISRIQLYYLARNTTDKDLSGPMNQLAPGPIWMYIVGIIIGFAVAAGVTVWWYRDMKRKGL